MRASVPSSFIAQTTSRSAAIATAATWRETAVISFCLGSMRTSEKSGAIAQTESAANAM
jgi:hypothetical protein